MSVPSFPFAPTPPTGGAPGRSRPGWVVWAAAAALVAAVAFVAGREYRAALDARPGPWSSPASVWVGVWLKQRDGRDGYELPALELRKADAWIAGRLVTAGTDKDHDVALPCENLTLGDDELTFTCTGGERVKYRLKLTSPDTGELFVIPDPDRALNEYLASSDRTPKGTLLSAEKRVQAFTIFGSPSDPQRIGRFVRVASRPTTPGR